MLRSETAANPERMARALEGLRRYQEAPRLPRPKLMPAIATRLGASLRDYGGTGAPVLFVPSLINPPNILDLDEERSLLRWLAARGHRPLLLDWGWEVAARRELSVAGHVEEILLPLLAELGEPPALVGYCLGGTMALAAAAGLSAMRGVATIAAPWHFTGYPAQERARLTALWKGSANAASSFGALPMEVLQSAFWSLDPARTIAKFESFAGMAPDSRAAADFVALEDWANDGPPVPFAAARELFEDFLANDAPGAGHWLVAGREIDPECLPCPLLTIVSATDRIVPRETSTDAGERIEVAAGHVGMVVGGKAREALWDPLADWLSRRTAT